MVFKDGRSREYMKGLDITGPPSIPRQFIVKKGGRGDVIVASDSEDEEEEEADNLNLARVIKSSDDSEEGEKAVGHFGDN